MINNIFMLRFLKGFYLFISVERGIMLFMISTGAAFLIGGRSDWPEVTYLGLIGFLGWSCVDAINNISDVELDKESDPFRSDFTASLHFWSFFIVLFLFLASIGMGLATNKPLVSIFILLGILLGIVYSVPPLRLRQTIYKPIVNSTVGAIPVLIASAFYEVFTIEVYLLAILMGAATAVNSLWEDLADYPSDLQSRASTFPIVLGFKRGLKITILLGYSLIPLMILIGLMFELGAVYYIILATLIAFLSLHVYQGRKTILGEETKTIHSLSIKLARDFVIIAVVHTTNLMLSGYIKNIFTQ